MTPASVLDCSALLRLYIPDGEIPDGTEAALEAALHGNHRLLAPELLFAEAGQVLWKKEQRTLLAEDLLRDIRDAIAGLPIELVGHRELFSSSQRIARQTGLTVYDALYLDLALRERADLLTADAKLAVAFEQLNRR